MSALLPAAVRDKLIACRLAQSPDTEGEPEAVHCAIGRLVVSRATAIIEALASQFSPQSRPHPGADKPMMEWRDAASECLDSHDDLLTGWETSFLRSILRQRYRLTAKQAAVVERIAARCGIWIQWGGW